MAARRPFWKWHRWKSIGFCLWPPSTCIWNLKLKFQSKLDLCSGNHVVYRQTDGRTDKVNPVYSNFVGRGYNNVSVLTRTGLMLRASLAVITEILYALHWGAFSRAHSWHSSHWTITSPDRQFTNSSRHSWLWGLQGHTLWQQGAFLCKNVVEPHFCAA